MKNNYLSLYAVTDSRWTTKDYTLSMQVEDAICGGVTCVQLREKDLDEESFYKEALVIKDICNRYKVPLIINDNVLLAKRIDADGVHVGQDDLNVEQARQILGKDKIIGVTAKTVEQALDAQRHGADYLGSGAVFGSTTKTNAKPMDLELLKSITAAVDIPVVAIGGIDITNAYKLKGTGIAGIAVVSGIFSQENIREASKKLKEVEL